MERNRSSISLKFRRTYSYSMQTVITFIAMLAIIIISVRYCDLHDYKSYYLSYNLYNKMDIEIGYTALASWFYKAGFPFYVYYGFLISLSIILLWRFINKNSKNSFLICVIFMIYPYINVLQQIRSFAGAAITLTALDFLLDEKERVIPYIALIILAMMFHLTCFVYLLFIYAVNTSIKSIRNKTIIAFCVGLPLIIVVRQIAPGLLSFFDYFSMKYTKYLYRSSNLSKASLLDWSIFFVITIVLTVVVNKEYAYYTERTKKLIRISFVVLTLTLLRGLGNNAYRIALMMYPILYVAIGNMISETNEKYTRITLSTVLLLFPLVSLFIWWGPANPQMYEIVKTEMWKVWNYYY